MERISKNLIEEGLNANIISFAIEDDLLTAHIGDYWFFISSEPNKNENDFSKEQLVDMIYEVINDEPINDDNEELATECLYYKSVLLEAI